LLAIPGDSDKPVLFDRQRLMVQSLEDELTGPAPEASTRSSPCS
jgi:hypothetical protein